MSSFSKATRQCSRQQGGFSSTQLCSLAQPKDTGRELEFLFFFLNPTERGQTGVVAREGWVLCCLTNDKLAFSKVISNKKTKQNSWARVGEQPEFCREATLIATLSGLDACGPAWCVLITNACSNELALLGAPHILS